MTVLKATQEQRPVARLDAGSIYEEGPPEELFRHLQKPRTQAFLKRVLEAGRLR
ncbi:hypothetical protein [Mesorhizobium sp. ORS 3428]|uniref:hypothetical protein n=1 Tax=Mesorhizobium sp. ORS 3428 TaxID=540997 RepID=UPI0012FF9709|nr:hypothetical protein [Mesorhizobium sp. ORS 3428]